MPARRSSWKELTPGIIALIGTTIAVVAVLRFARVGALHGETARIYVTVEEAKGIIRGTPVWLSGKQVGIVDGIHFGSPASDTLNRVVIALDVVERHREHLRHDSPVQIRSGGTLIGAPVVYFGAGTSRAAAVRKGDTVHATGETELGSMMEEFEGAAKEFPAIMSNVKLLGEQLRAGRGTLGAMGLEQEGTPMQAARTNASRLGERLSGGRGVVAQALGGGGGVLGARVSRVMARADSVRALLASDATSFGRFRRDSTLLREVEDIRNELSIVQAMLDEPRGTAGRAMKDSVIVQELARTSQEMTLLFADIKKRPLRYVRF